MVPRHRGWLRLWLVLSGLSLIAVVVTIALDRANRWGAPCIAKEYFERVAITIPSNSAPLQREAETIHMPRDLKEAEAREALQKYFKLNDQAMTAAMQTWRIELSDDAMGIGQLEVSGCGGGYFMPKPELRAKEPYASAIRDKVSSATAHISWRLGGFWVVANAVVVAFFFLVVWITRGFAVKSALSSDILAGATAQDAQFLSQAQVETKSDSRAMASVEPRNKILLGLEFLLHGFAMALGVPIANAAGFGGAIPVMMVMFVFAFGSVCVVWAVRKALAKSPLRTTVLAMLPLVYLGAYMAAYVAIRS